MGEDKVLEKGCACCIVEIVLAGFEYNIRGEEVYTNTK